MQVILYIEYLIDCRSHRCLLNYLSMFWAIFCPSVRIHIAERAVKQTKRQAESMALRVDLPSDFGTSIGGLGNSRGSARRFSASNLGIVAAILTCCVLAVLWAGWIAINVPERDNVVEGEKSDLWTLAVAAEEHAVLMQRLGFEVTHETTAPPTNASAAGKPELGESLEAFLAALQPAPGIRVQV